ncbi:MAG: hypothetical protein FWG18_02975 [Alphaproteobacteria bacterium]|nr:hypothetical protein [Alphaproteobacteria bacterium]
MRRYLLLTTCYLLLALPLAAAQIIATPGGTPVAGLAGDLAPAQNYWMSPIAFNAAEPFMNERMRNELRPRGTAYAVNPSAGFARVATGTQITPVSNFVPALSGDSRARAAAGRDNARALNYFGPPASNMAPATNVVGVSAPLQNTSMQRRTVARAAAPAGNAARAATPMAQPGNVARAGTNIAPAANNAAARGQNASQQRRVVARSARTDSVSGRTVDTAVSGQFVANVSAERCLADYTDCMDGYCRREGTFYNRCYCSPRLAQIDAEFKPAINASLEQIMILMHGNGVAGMSDLELEELWESTFTGNVYGNSLASLNASLANIDWADFESRARGQTAFVTGHDFCVQHLKGCYYMAQNMKSIYRSEIARDCAAYEVYLERLKTAAESAVRELGGS